MLFENSFQNYTDRVFYPDSQYTVNCTPGAKLFVDTHGDFHLCEKVNHSLPIGNCITGFDVDKIIKIEKKYYKEVVEANRCWECTSRKLCSSCFGSTLENKSFNNSQICNKNKNEIAEYFKYYYSILEDNPQFKIFLKNVKKEKISLLDRTI